MEIFNFIILFVKNFKIGMFKNTTKRPTDFCSFVIACTLKSLDLLQDRTIVL
jgi:hypothetical protein